MFGSFAPRTPKERQKLPSRLINTIMDALIWDANPDAHRFAEAALQAILLAYPELEQHKGSDGVKAESMQDLFNLAKTS